MVPPVFVIILNWNGTDDTLSAVTSIEQQRYAACRIVVIDNGSDELSLAPLLAPGRPFHLIRNSHNLGFAGGCNVGIRYALEQGAAYIWLFNSDAIAPPDTLRTLVAAAETEPRAGLVAPMMRDIRPPHPVMNLGGRFDPHRLVYRYTDSIETATEWQAQFPDQIVLMGTALLIRRAVAERIGGFDESLFAYWEDIDYCIRSNAAGFTNRLVPGTALLHPAKHAGDRAVKLHYHYYMYRNKILLLRKHGAGIRKWQALRWATLEQLRTVELLKGNRPAFQAALAGVWDGWLNRGGSFSPRRQMPQPLRAVLERCSYFVRILLGDSN